MRKLNYLALAALAAAAMNAQAQDVTFGNPKDADGNYIVKWNYDTESFAESNDWEVDETFIFAIDVTGTPLEAALATPSRNPAVLGRGVAYDLYVTSCPEDTEGAKNVDGRLFHIKDNVYGMIVNFFQQHVSRFKDAGLLPNADFTDYECLQPGYVTSWGSNIFGFGWSNDNPGAEWWDGVAAPIQGEFSFSSAPYTGTKADANEWTFGEVVEEGYSPFNGLDAGSFHSMCDAWGGYAPSEFWDKVKEISAVKTVAADAQTVSSKYFDLQGRQIEEPAQGLYIRQDVKADGSVKAVKVIK